MSSSPRTTLDVRTVALAACPNCGGPRDHPALRFCKTCRRVAL